MKTLTLSYKKTMKFSVIWDLSEERIPGDEIPRT